MYTRRRDTSQAILDHWRSMQSLHWSWKDLPSVSRTYIQDSATSHDMSCSEGNWRRNHDHGMKARLFGSVNASEHYSSCGKAFSESAPCTLYLTDEQGFQIIISIFYLSFYVRNIHCRRRDQAVICCRDSRRKTVQRGHWFQAERTRTSHVRSERTSCESTCRMSEQSIFRRGLKMIDSRSKIDLRIWGLNKACDHEHLQSFDLKRRYRIFRRWQRSSAMSELQKIHCKTKSVFQ